MIEGEDLERRLALDGGIVHEGIELAGRGQAGIDGSVIGHIELEALGNVEIGEERGVPCGGDHLMSGS